MQDSENEFSRNILIIVTPTLAVMTGPLEQLKQEYRNTAVGKLFVIGVVFCTLIGVGAGGLVGNMVMIEVVGWETRPGQIVGGAVGALATVFLVWITGPVPWRLWEYW